MRETNPSTFTEINSRLNLRIFIMNGITMDMKVELETRYLPVERRDYR